MDKVRHISLIYFILQGIAVIGWWLTLIQFPATRLHFQLEQGSQTSLMAFWLPDMIFLALGSLIAAGLVFFRNQYEVAAIWFLTGAVSYAAIYSLSYALITDNGWLGVMLMLPSMLWSGVFSTVLTVKNGMFRAARPTSSNYVVLKTFVQIVVVWSVILVLIPYFITILEDKLGVSRISFPFQGPLAIGLFVALSSIGVYGAYVMSRLGRGTPLPLDHATDLVVKGPYAWVRNPMAVSGVGQGLSVALFLGSPLVAIYALMGSAIWQFVFRPMEEDDLERRFGSSYQDYRRNVRCWLPRTSPYRSHDQ